MSFPPDLAEREQALDPTTSFIVEAPAGSGKTTLLVNRLLRLLTTVERPEAVVAVTFTRKAAAEMRERVLQKLANPDSELALKALEHSRKLDWNLERDSSRLQIQTIDSLCAALTRQTPVMSELGGSPEVVEHVEELYHVAARRAMTTLAEGTDQDRERFRRLALHFESNLGALENRIVQMLAKREQWLDAEIEPADVLVEDVLALMHRSAQELTDVFRLSGKVDFTEVTRAAISALGDADHPSDLLYALDYRIQHLLVDEFQDTSRSQYALINALTREWSDGDGRTLFLVGDPMQSIYMFRQAELSLFLECWQNGRLGSVRLERLRLSANFRSTTQLVEWTQKVFRPLLIEDDAHLGKVSLRPAIANPEKSLADPNFTAFVDDDGEREAERVVEIIRSIPNPGDSAILVRGRRHLFAILPALRRAGIPYEAIEIDALEEQQHIVDLLALTRALLHSGDRVAWLACLRAPWCGLALADLTGIAEREDRTILDAISDTEKMFSLSQDARTRLARVQPILIEAAALVGRMPFRDLVERTWIALGGPSILSGDEQGEDAAGLFDLIEQFDEGGTIRDFSLLQARLEFLYAKPVADKNAIKVMTIHSAKGLEFDTVIIPQLGQYRSRREKDLLLWSDARAAAKPAGEIPDDSVYALIDDENKAKEKEELKRLFYVAVTRAKSRLYLTGCVSRKKNGDPGSAYEGSFLKYIHAMYKDEFAKAARRTFRVAADAQRPAAVNILRRLPSTWRVPAMPEPLQWKPAVRTAPASGRRITYEWVGDAARHAGTIVHEVLKRITRDGADAWNSERVSTMKPLFQSELRRLGVSEEKQTADKIAQAISSTLESERGRWILAPHADARSEWTIAGLVNGNLITGQVDRCFRDEHGTLWIIDFKTSEHSGSNLPRFLATERERYRQQLESYAQIVSRLETGPIAMGLYFPLHDAWLEWQWAEVVTAAS